MFVHHFTYRNWRLRLEARPRAHLLLYVNDCLRKEREGEGSETLYVWTNLELEWEEHHWIEARLLPADAAGDRVLRVTSNGEALFEVNVAAEAIAG